MDLRHNFTPNFLTKDVVTSQEIILDWTRRVLIAIIIIEQRCGIQRVIFQSI